jgi:hypothetical protein
LSPLLPPPGLYKPRCRNPGMAGDKRQSGSNTSDIQRWLLFSVFSLVTHGRGDKTLLSEPPPVHLLLLPFSPKPTKWLQTVGPVNRPNTGQTTDMEAGLAAPGVRTCLFAMRQGGKEDRKGGRPMVFFCSLSSQTRYSCA